MIHIKHQRFFITELCCFIQATLLAALLGTTAQGQPPTNVPLKELQNPECDDLSKVNDQLRTQLESTTLLNSDLMKINAGQQPSSNMPLDFYFSIDLEDEQAVAQRLKELELELEPNSAKLPTAEPTPAPSKCAKYAAQMQELKSKLSIEQQSAKEQKTIYFKKSPTERSNLLSAIISHSIPDDTAEINEKIEQNRIEKQELEKQRIQAEKQLAEAKDRIAKQYAEANVEIQQYRETLAEASAKWFTELKQVMDKYDAIEAKIEGIRTSIAGPGLTENEYKILYSKVKNTWRTLIDDGFVMYRLAFEEQGVVTAPIKAPLQADKIGIENMSLYEQSHRSAVTEYENLLKTQSNALETKVNQYFSILAKASEARAEILAKLDFHTLTNESGGEYFSDLSREIFAIPFRFVGIGFVRYFEFKRDLDGGIAGIWSILKKLLALIALFFVPFMARGFSKLTTSKLDDYRRSLLKRRRSLDPFSLKIAFWIQRLTPYIPWILYIVFLEIVEKYIAGTVYEELSIAIPLLEYFLFYKMFQLAVRDALFSLRNFVQIEQKDTKPLVDRTTKIVGRFFLLSFSIMHLTDSTVDRGLVFGHVQLIMQVLGIAVCAYAVMAWKAYLAPASENIFGGKLGKSLSSYCSGKLSFVFCLPTLLLILAKIAGNSLWDWFSELEISKKFFAKLYRKKVESLGAEVAQAAVEELPDDYRELFSLEGLSDDRYLVASNQRELDAVSIEINDWIAGGEEDQSVVIFGEKGIGKTTLLNRLSRQYDELNVINLDVPPKICDKESLATFLTDSLSIETTDNVTRAILELNKKATQKTLILVDNAHNLFVGKVGGFEALKSFIEVVNLNTENLFWCVVFNEYSWAYLKGVLGNSEYFRTEIHLKSWTDDSIKELITNRHATTKYKLSYDKIILASRSSNASSEALSYAEEQFFRLLWEQSNGNPRVALYLWLNCLNVKGQHKLKVGLPERPKTEKLSDNDDTLLFVLSAVANLENATRKEISDTINLPMASVSHALKMAVEDKFLFKSSGNRYRLGFSYQCDLIRQLKVKNFIHGID